MRRILFLISFIGASCFALEFNGDGGSGNFSVPDPLNGTGVGPARFGSTGSSIGLFVNGSATNSFNIYASSITNTSGNVLLLPTSVLGTSNQVIATPAASGVTLSLPQSIATTSTPQFGNLGLGIAASAARKLNISGTGLSVASAPQIGIRNDLTATTGGSNSLLGSQSVIVANKAGGTFASVYGNYMDAQNNAGTVTAMYGDWVRTYAFNGSTTTLAAGLMLTSYMEATAKVVDMYGLKVNGLSYTTNLPTSYYGVWIGTAPVSAGTSEALHTESGNVVFNANDVATSSVTIKGGGLVVGVGTANLPVSDIMRGSASLDFGATAAGACDALTITVTGAADGDEVLLGIPTALAGADAYQNFWGYVSSANTVTVKRCNPTNATTALTDAAAATVKATVIH